MNLPFDGRSYLSSGMEESEENVTAGYVLNELKKILEMIYRAKFMNQCDPADWSGRSKCLNS